MSIGYKYPRIKDIDKLLAAKRAERDELRHKRIQKYEVTCKRKYRVQSTKEKIVTAEINKLRAARNYRIGAEEKLRKRAKRKRKERLITEESESS